MYTQPRIASPFREVYLSGPWARALMYTDGGQAPRNAMWEETVAMHVTPTWNVAAGLRTAGALDNITRLTGTGIAPEFTQVLAAAPERVDSLWSCIQPVVDEGRLSHASDPIRMRAGKLAAKAITFPDHLQWLCSRGFTREDCRQVRYVVEVFHHLEPVSAILAAISALWASGACPGGLSKNGARTRESCFPCFCGDICLLENDLVPLRLRFPITNVPGFVHHPFCRALAVWPEYAEQVCSTLASASGSGEWRAGVDDLYCASLEVARKMMGEFRNHEWVCADSSNTLLACVRRSCEVMLAVCGLRRMFIHAETAARRNREYKGVHIMRGGAGHDFRIPP